MPPPTLPPDYHRIRLVQNFDELVATPFADGVNALCWPRTLPGDFGEIVSLLSVGVGITPLEEARLQRLPVSAAGRIAVDTLLEDQRMLQDHGLAPELNCIHGYLPIENPGPL